MFKPGTKPSAYGYEPTWERVGGQYKVSTIKFHRRREEWFSEHMFGNRCRLGGLIGNKISHLLRTVDEKWGSGMKPTHEDVYGFYYDLDYSFS